MITKTVIATLVFVNLLPLILASFCDLKLMNKEWLDDYSLVLTKDANEEYQFLREGNVENSVNLYMICGSAPLITTAKCENGKFSKTLPLKKKCEEKNSIVPSKIDMKVGYCPYRLYKIGFNVKIGEKTHFMETYQVCFDKQHLRPLFTINKAYPIADGRPDTLKFNPDEIFYGNTFHAFDRRSTFDRFKYLLGTTQKYMSSTNLDHIIDRGHLTPSADFITTNLKKSTFNMINVIPQFRTINNDNWRLIEQWARDKSHTPATICTGVLDCNLDSTDPAELNCILKLKHVSGNMVAMFLANDRKLPIPLWIYKIVRSNNNDRTVFMTYNNIYHKGKIQPPSNVCDVIDCPTGINIDQTIAKGRTFCCEYEKFLNKVVPYLKEKC